MGKTYKTVFHLKNPVINKNICKYINEVQARLQASDINHISIMSLYGTSVNEQRGYRDCLLYLISKNKVGVVNNLRGCLKDVYLVALRGKRAYNRTLEERIY